MLQIGNLKLMNWLVMAPMAGITNLPFRLTVKRLGAGLVTTEMISAMGLKQGQKRTLAYLKSLPDDKPLSVQLFGTKPEIMAAAAEIAVERGADIVDINMGCPAKKVIKTGAGGALLRAQHTVGQIVSAVRRACTVPLTAKIRAGWSPGQPCAREIAQVLEDYGVDAVTVHPRSVTQGFSGRSDWRIISTVKATVKIPVIGNGDVTTPFLAGDMKNQTGCDGVMIGRGAIGNPWIFKQIQALERGEALQYPTLSERKSFILNHFHLLALSMDEKRAARAMRGLLLWYTKGLPYSAGFRGSIAQVKDLNSLVSALDQYFSTIKTDRNALQIASG